MTDKLETLQVVLLERLSTIEKVHAYTESPFAEDLSGSARRHLIPNQVRARIAREHQQLRMEFSGFIISAHPNAGINIDEWVAQTFPGNTPMVMPPMWYKDKEGNSKEFESIVTSGNKTLAISSFDGGLGKIIIHETTRPESGLKEYMLWHPPVQQILLVTAEEVEKILGLTEHSPRPSIREKGE